MRLDDPAVLWEALRPELASNTFAQCALDLAAHDLWGKLQGQPVWKLWGLRRENVPLTDYTIGIDTIDVMVQKMEEFAGWPIYKIKLGTPDDLRIVRELRRHTRAPSSASMPTVRGTPRRRSTTPAALAELGVEFIEQPLPADRLGRDAAGLPPLGPAADRRRKLPDRGRRRPLPRLLPRRQRQARQVRRPHAGPADARPRPAAGPEDDGRLHDRIDRRHFGDRPTAAAAWTTSTWTARCSWPATSPPACASTAAA